MAEETREQLDDKVLEEEYKVWKKNSPFLYDLVITHALEWPSLTTQWLPEVRRTSDREVCEHKLILGTQSDGQDPNYLMIAEVRTVIFTFFESIVHDHVSLNLQVLLPNDDTAIDARKYDDEKGEIGGYGGTLSKVSIKVKISHDGDVHRARYMPQNSVQNAISIAPKNVITCSFHGLILI